jgi:competence protein ComEC
MDIGEEVVSPYLWWRRIKNLDWVVLTHAHHDHLDGLRAIAENFGVGAVWVSCHPESQAYRNFLEVLAKKRIPLQERRAGERFSVGVVEGEIFAPEKNPSSPRPPADNDSLVVLLRFGSGSEVIRVLLPGDIEGKVEHRLVEKGAALASEILKVPHHGSRGSSSEEFLSAVKARYQVMSVGEGNPFGHPHAEALERLAQTGGRLFRTDRDGAVTFLTDGRTIEVVTYSAATR